MPYLLIALLALGIAAVQAGIGGVSLLYALPAYGIIGLAALCSLFEPAKRLSGSTSVRCLAAAIVLAAWIVTRAIYSPVDYLARPDLFMTLAALVVYLLSAVFLAETRSRHLLFAILFVFAGAHLACGVAQFTAAKGQFMFLPWIKRADYAWRASGFYLNPNHLAGLLEVLGVMATSLACWSNWRLGARMTAGYTALLCFIGIVLTGNRGGYVSTLAGLLVLAGISLYVIRRLRPAHFWPTVMVVVMLFSAAIGGGGTLLLKTQWMVNRVKQYEDSKNNAVPAEDCEAVFFEESNEERDDEQRAEERGEGSDQQQRAVGGPLNGVEFRGELVSLLGERVLVARSRFQIELAIGARRVPKISIRTRCDLKWAFCRCHRKFCDCA